MLVAIGIGGRAASRKWPLPSYAELVARLNQHRGVQSIIVCAREEEAEAEELADRLPIRPYVLSGVPLRCACAVLERCDLFVGNDSGTAHLAAAMDCRTIVISRHPQCGDPNHANSPVRFAPRCSHFRVVQPPLGAGDCLSACRVGAPHCIKLVTVDMVVNAALDLLRMEQAPASSTRPHGYRPSGDIRRRWGRRARSYEFAVMLAWLDWRQSRGGRITAAVSSGAAARVLSSLLTLVSLPVAVRYLGAERFGVWATITSTVVVAEPAGPGYRQHADQSRGPRLRAGRQITCGALHNQRTGADGGDRVAVRDWCSPSYGRALIGWRYSTWPPACRAAK